MKQIKEILISPEATLYQAVESIGAGALQILLVVDETGRLLGSITDGDIRRSILQGRSMDASITQAMNSEPVVAMAGTSREMVLSLMQRHVKIGRAHV